MKQNRRGGALFPAAALGLATVLAVDSGIAEDVREMFSFGSDDTMFTQSPLYCMESGATSVDVQRPGEYGSTRIVWLGRAAVLLNVPLDQPPSVDGHPLLFGIGKTAMSATDRANTYAFTMHDSEVRAEYIWAEPVMGNEVALANGDVASSMIVRLTCTPIKAEDPTNFGNVSPAATASTAPAPVVVGN